MVSCCICNLEAWWLMKDDAMLKLLLTKRVVNIGIPLFVVNVVHVDYWLYGVQYPLDYCFSYSPRQDKKDKT